MIAFPIKIPRGGKPHIHLHQGTTVGNGADKGSDLQTPAHMVSDDARTGIAGIAKKLNAVRLGRCGSPASKTAIPKTANRVIGIGDPYKF